MYGRSMSEESVFGHDLPAARRVDHPVRHQYRPERNLYLFEGQDQFSNHIYEPLTIA